MLRLRTVLIATLPLLIPAPAFAQQPPTDPLRFFVGTTEDEGVMKVMFRSPYRTRTVSEGKIEPDGSLVLLQRVEDEGEPQHQRLWRVRQIAPGHYVGTMSDADGPVIIDKIGDRYRFQFRMKGLSVEQWLTPLSGGMAARSSLKVQKLGMTVATDEALIRKITAN